MRSDCEFGDMKGVLDTDKVILSSISTSTKSKVYFDQRGDKCDEIARGQ